MGHCLPDGAGVNGGFMLADSGLECGELCGKLSHPRPSRVGHNRQLFGDSTAGKDAVHGIVIRRADRLVFVVVAAGTRYGKAHQAAGDKIDPVVDDVVLVAQKRAAYSQESQSRQILSWHSRLDAIGSNLQRNELVVREIPRQGTHHPVAIRPRKRIAAVLVVKGIAHRIGVACQIQPLPGPVFGMFGGG